MGHIISICLERSPQAFKYCYLKKILANVIKELKDFKIPGVYYECHFRS